MADAGVCGPDDALAGLCVLVTRPRHQSDGLVALIEKCGGEALRFPVIDILPVRDPGAAQRVLADLDDFAWVIFLSPNAVTHGLSLMDITRARAARVRFMAVGEGSAAALEQAGFPCVLRPRGASSSEALLALPELAPARVAGARILIVKGEGGRQLLGDTLSKRGAQVTYAAVYRRACPRVDGATLADRGRNGGIDTIIITSVEGLENLFAMLGKGAAGWLKKTGYVVASERVAARARELGIRDEPVVADGADDGSLLEALLRWRAVRLDVGE